MSQHAATSCGHCGLTIAGVNFDFSGSIDETALAAPFHDFLGDPPTADLRCRVDCLGADASMMAEPPNPDEPWSFSVKDGAVSVLRRENRTGVPLWRITGPLAFDSAAVAWNPLRFREVYGTFENTLARGFGVSLLMLSLRARGGLLLHGVAAEVAGQGILGVGVSGQGKSTLARLLDAAGATVLTDERPVLRQWPPPGGAASPPVDFRIHGSPWPSSAGFARQAWAPLRRIYFLEHGTSDRITPLSPREAVRRLIPVTTIPWQAPECLDPCLATLGLLVETIPCAVLGFQPTPAVVQTIRTDLLAPAGGI